MPIVRWLLCGILLAGCANAPVTQTGTPSLSPTPLASPTAEPQLTDRQLRSVYLSAVQPFNEFTCRFLRRHGTSTDMNTWMEFTVMYSSHIRAFADRVHAMDWNRKTRGEARRLTEALAAQELGYRFAARQQDPDTFWVALDATDALDAEVTRAADLLRGALSLKSVRPCI